MSYNPPSNENDLRKLNKSLGVVRNIARFTNYSTNVNTTPYGIGSTSVSKTMSFSLAFQNPAVCVLTNSSGVYHLSLQTSNTIVDGTGSSLSINYLDGTLNNGQYVMLRPQKGKTLTLVAASDLSGNHGNLYLNSNITLTENEYVELTYYKDLGTGTSGMYITSIGSGGSEANTALSNLINPTAINQDLIFGTGLSTTAKNIDNVDTIYFKDSTTGGSPPHISTSSFIQPSGDSTEVDIYLIGYQAFALSAISNQAILQIYGKAGTATIKPTSLEVNPEGTIVGGISFDGFNSSTVEKTYASVNGHCVAYTAGTELGKLTFNILNNGVFNEVGYVDNSGWNFDQNFIQNFSYPVKYITNNNSYTVQPTDVIISYIGTTGTANVTLPLSTSFGGRTLYLIDNGTGGIVNFNTQAGDFINGFTTLTANTRYEKYIIMSDGIRWIQMV